MHRLAKLSCINVACPVFFHVSLAVLSTFLVAINIPKCVAFFAIWVLAALDHVLAPLMFCLLGFCGKQLSMYVQFV